MKLFLPCLAVFLALAARTSAQTAVSSQATRASNKNVVATTATDTDRVPLWEIGYDSAYTAEADINHGGKIGDGASFYSGIELTHRRQLTGDATGGLYLHLGLAYSRFDFTGHTAVLPVHLQSAAAVIGVDYYHGTDLGALLQIRPGFYFEEHMGVASFDAPLTAGRVFILKQDELYFFAGLNASLLRGGFPVLPLAGVVWKPNTTWNIYAVLPEPRVVYSPNKKLDFYAGGEFAGSSYRTDDDAKIRPRKLSGAVVDYREYRVGVGMSYECTKTFSVDIGAGCTIQREYNFNRADQNFRTDPAPYVRLSLNASF